MLVGSPVVPSRRVRRAAFARAGVVLAIVVGLDQLTKHTIAASVAPGDTRKFLPLIDLVHVRNTGVAFGALSGAGLIVLAVTLVALAALIVYFGTHASTPMLWLPVGIIAGGALGNLADRARQGAVIDFIDPVLWPAFNLADAGIVLGILGLLYVAERPRAPTPG